MSRDLSFNLFPVGSHVVEHFEGVLGNVIFKIDIL
jgi:hypothetical protein